MSKLIQAVSWQTSMSSEAVLSVPWYWGARPGKACLSTCCLSPGEAPGEGMSVECGYICID